MISVTERAASKALALAQKEGRPAILRVGVKGGGCSGFSYFVDFVTDVGPTDHVVEIQGLKVICDPKSLQLIDKTELDYETNLMNSGFRFKNPNAARSCSCGESFSVEQ